MTDEHYRNLVDALCLASIGWSGDEREAYAKATEVIYAHGKRRMLEVLREDIDRKLREFDAIASGSSVGNSKAP